MARRPSSVGGSAGLYAGRDGGNVPPARSVSSSIYPMLGQRTNKRRRLKLCNDGSEDGDILKLGEAIRNGDLKEVKSFLEENGVHNMLNTRFCFEVYAQRLAMYREDEFLPSTMEPVPIKVTPLQLAVLCKRSQLLEYLLSSASPSIGMQELNNMLSVKAKIDFPKGIQNYVDRDQALQVYINFNHKN